MSSDQKPTSDIHTHWSHWLGCLQWLIIPLELGNPLDRPNQNQGIDRSNILRSIFFDCSLGVHTSFRCGNVSQATLSSNTIMSRIGHYTSRTKATWQMALQIVPTIPILSISMKSIKPAKKKASVPKYTKVVRTCEKAGETNKKNETGSLPTSKPLRHIGGLYKSYNVTTTCFNKNVSDSNESQIISTTYV